MNTSMDRFARETAAGYDRGVIDGAGIVVVGAGALGGAIMQLLALVGFPEVICIDMDRYEEANAPRSVFYQPDSPKAQCVSEGARRLCRATGEIRYQYTLKRIQSLGDSIFLGFRRTIVISAVDCPDTRRWIAQRSRHLGIPLIEGGFHAGRWNASVISNSSSDDPCWACGQGDLIKSRLFSCDAYANASMAQGSIPATAPVAASLGAFMVEALVGILHGNSPLTDCTVAHDMRRGATVQMKRRLDPNCVVDHRRLNGDIITLNSGPTSTVRDLLLEVHQVCRDAIVSLPAEYIRAAPCKNCRKSVEVNLPAWRIDNVPTCKECGGSFTTTKRLPEQLGFLTSETTADIQDHRLIDLGLGPGLRLDVEGRNRQVAVVLAGDVARELTAVEEQSVNKVRH